MSLPLIIVGAGGHAGVVADATASRLDPMRSRSFVSLACCGFVVAASSIFIGCPKSERTSPDPAASGSGPTPASVAALASIVASGLSLLWFNRLP